MQQGSVILSRCGVISWHRIASSYPQLLRCTRCFAIIEQLQCHKRIVTDTQITIFQACTILYITFYTVNVKTFPTEKTFLLYPHGHHDAVQLVMEQTPCVARMTLFLATQYKHGTIVSSLTTATNQQLCPHSRHCRAIMSSLTMLLSTPALAATKSAGCQLSSFTKMEDFQLLRTCTA